MNKIVTKDGKEIILDCVISLDKKRSGRLTKYKVENGAEISDHFVLENDTYQIQALFSDQGTKDKTIDDYITTYNAINAIFETGKSFKLATNREIKDNLLITSLSDSRNAENGKSIMLTMTVEQLRTARSKTINNSKVVDKELKNRLFTKSLNGQQVLTPANFSLTGKTNKLIDPQISTYKPPFKL